MKSLIERFPGKPGSGVEYYTVVYVDHERKPVEKSKAVAYWLHEYDKHDRPFRVSLGLILPSRYQENRTSLSLQNPKN